MFSRMVLLAARHHRAGDVADKPTVLDNNPRCPNDAADVFGGCRSGTQLIGCREKGLFCLLGVRNARR